jgi:para-nitrobenzyl esterase
VKTSSAGAALLAAALLSSLAACGGGSDDLDVSTTYGVVSGKESSQSLQYLGIPYAAPPVGVRRWRAPEAPAAWTGKRDAKGFAPHCPQPGTAFGVASTREDCLYLNVYTPKAPGTYPVMVWIHGGAFYLGQSDGYDPSRLVAQGNVVVTLNYRLGALGFLSHPALTAEQNGSSGNYGLMDQQAALRWVRGNIAGFGGNPNNITVFGESAGGFSVHAHLASAASTGLFHKAIIQSGAYALAGAQPTLAQAEATGTGLADANGCAAPDDTVACLRNLPVATLLAAQSVAWPSGPVPSVDGAVLDGTVLSKLLTGTHNRVPLIQGTTRDEWRLFVGLDELSPPTVAKPYLGAPLTSANHAQAITGTFPFLAAQATGLAAVVYPASAYGNSAGVALGALGTDLLFTCNARWSSRLQKAYANVYAYEFADDTVAPFLPGVSFPLGAAHTSELNFIFDLANAAPRTPAQETVAASLVSAWSNFARTGNPNGAAAPTAWPAHGTSESVLQFNPVGTTLIPDATFNATHRCSTVWTPGI